MQEAENVTDGEELDRSEAYRYRHLEATVNYLSMDRPDVQQAFLAVRCRGPQSRVWWHCNEWHRYLRKHPSMEFEYSRTSIEEASMMEGYSDSDWAGCRATRRSSSGGILALGGCALKCWSNRHGSVALSSGEKEYYYASVKTLACVLRTSPACLSSAGICLRSAPDHFCVTFCRDVSSAQTALGPRGCW